MTTERPEARKRYEDFLTYLKLTLVGLTLVVLVWLVGWFSRSEWLSAAEAQATESMPGAGFHGAAALPTVRPWPTPRPGAALRPTLVLEPLPTPLPGVAQPGWAASRALPPLEPRIALPSLGEAGRVAPGAQMPALKPIPPLPALPPARAAAARSRGS